MNRTRYARRLTYSLDRAQEQYRSLNGRNMKVICSVHRVASLGTALRALTLAGYRYSAAHIKVATSFDIRARRLDQASYPAKGIWPRRVACGGVGGKRSLAGCRRCGVGSWARPTAPPRPALRRLAANTLALRADPDLLRFLQAKRAWAHGPFRGSLVHSGQPALRERRCTVERVSGRALSNTGLKRTRSSGC